MLTRYFLFYRIALVATALMTFSAAGAAVWKLEQVFKGEKRQDHTAKGARRKRYDHRGCSHSTAATLFAHQDVSVCKK
jgi:hypothetical protein